MKEAHIRRWQITAAFVIVVAVFVVTTIRVSHVANSAHDSARRTAAIAAINTRLLRELARTKASVRSLRLTDCGLKAFLEAARQIRQRVEQHEKDPALRAADRKAVAGYDAILRPFRGLDCPTPRAK